MVTVQRACRNGALRRTCSAPAAAACPLAPNSSPPSTHPSRSPLTLVFFPARTGQRPPQTAPPPAVRTREPPLSSSPFYRRSDLRQFDTAGVQESSPPSARAPASASSWPILSAGVARLYKARLELSGDNLLHQRHHLITTEL